MKTTCQRLSPTALFSLLVVLSPSFTLALPVAELICSDWGVGPLAPGVHNDLVEHPSNGWFYGTSQSGGGLERGCIFRMNTDGLIEPLVAFGGKIKGYAPVGRLTLGQDGNFYGMTDGATSTSSGEYMAGTVFRMTPEGMLTTLVEFGAPIKGSYPTGSLTLGRDGNFYGMTKWGGAESEVVSSSGTIFRITPGGELTTLVKFLNDSSATHGANPTGTPTLGTDGNFYGMTERGGSSGNGTVFRMTPDGVLTTLLEFTGNEPPNKGFNPQGSLTLGRDGNFYGMTPGTVFRMTPEGLLTTLVEFTSNGSSNKGYWPYGSLTLGQDDNFYGITSGGGQYNHGTVFRMTASGSLTTLVEFTGNSSSNKGAEPFGSMTLGQDGNFYGMTGHGGRHDRGTAFRMTPAGVLATLAEFNPTGATLSGGSLTGSLTLGPDGNFYGMTAEGGIYGKGTVFRMTPAGLRTKLVDFSGNGDINKGMLPYGSLTMGSDDKLYGMTMYGGSTGYGTVFRMTSSGLLSTLVEFTGNGTNNAGCRPTGSLTQGLDGNLYGMTDGGGNGFNISSGYWGYGTVFRMTPDGVLSTLVKFTDDGTGGGPKGALTLGADGDFYGVTTSGGNAEGHGTAFRMTHEGVFTRIAVFGDGKNPAGGLTQGPDGNFFGTTRSGGYRYGTVFRMNPSGTITTLMKFTGPNGPNKGGFSHSRLTLGPDGAFYGMTNGYDPLDGQHIGLGTVFRITTNGDLCTILKFTGSGNSADSGANSGSSIDGGVFSGTSLGNLTSGPDGKLYGMTAHGGPRGGGTVFRLDFEKNAPAPEIVVEQPTGKPLTNGGNAIKFGIVPIGGKSSLEFTIRNTGNSDLEDLAITKDGGTSSLFTVSNLDVSTLHPGGNTTFTVTFNSYQEGPVNTTLQISSSDCEDHIFTVPLSGNGYMLVPEITIEQPAGNILLDGAATVALGAVLVGKTVTTSSFIIRNTGNANLAGLAITKTGSHAGDYVIAGPSTGTLVSGASTTFTVAFKPTAGGPRFAAIHIVSNDADESPFDINLTGTATVPAPEIAVEQPEGSGLLDGVAKKSFGTAKVGKKDTAKTFTIKNTGTADLSGLAVTKDGKHAKEFIISNPAKTSLVPGASTTFKLSFKPKTKGTRKAAIHIRSNDANENPFDIKVTGLGAAP